MKSILCVLILLLALPVQAKEASAEQLARRLYLDLFERLPSVKEYEKATAAIVAGKYENLVNEMMNDEEYFMTLSAKIVKHYAPPKEIRTHNFLSYKRLEHHIRKTYVSKKSDFRKFLGDIMTARGIPATNPMVLMYSMDEDAPLMTARFSAQVMGVPMKCAQCHDHKIHPDIVVDDFWSMAAFFKGMEKKLVGDLQSLKKFQKQMGPDAKMKLDFESKEVSDIEKWINLELKEESIYNNLSNEELLGQDIGHGLTRYAIDEADLRDEDKIMLKAPQLVIGEYKNAVGSMKIDYELDGEKFMF